ncbi:ABC transporter substrate-binding protein [Komagataeibacter sucrofermentans]|uniref:ABC transporter substrate-binding protein n=1 Tax=Komagataeibacter sucrofermentans TaxID=1053551 RepID=A0A318QTH3_9PROT|nr:ABC transporter substrate-binding protein [Komagataeibacter sucrofermentans]PYD80632.1 ABC transporter substrate-binding protein [Komagataeibacter sucrofermentans]GBQ50639.1 ABC transporter periplasmic protein [Komagataeibacter sucrofermentans DSM 15973]
MRGGRAPYGTTGALGRRQALRLAGAGLVAATLPARAGRACAQDAQPRRGGHLNFAGLAASTADTLDPARFALATDYIRGHMFYDGLVMLDADMMPRPALAERIESDDLQTWHITLRRGVTFHDGAALDAADVVYSLARHKDPAVGSQQRVIAQEMADIKAVGPLEVRVTLHGPNADFPSMLGIVSFSIVRDGTTDFSRTNGTGPFICTEFTPGVRTSGRRNPNFWRGPAPWLDSVDMIGISDDMSRHNALLSNDVDIIASVNPRLVRLLRARGFGVMESPVGTYTDLAIRLDEGPGRSQDFVTGMKYLFNREQVRDSVFLGFARLGNDQPIPPEHRYFAADLPQRSFDPDRARFYLQRSGMMEAGVPLVCSPAALASVDIAVVLQYAAQQVGMSLPIRRMPADGYWTEYWMKTPMGFGNTNPRPSLDMTFALNFASGAPWNESHWRDPRFDQLLLAARSQRDEGARRQIYHDMQVMIHDGAGICLPAFTTSLDAFNPRVRGLAPSQAGQLMGYDFLSHVWLADAPGGAA